MKRKIICLLLVVAMTVAVFASCGGSENDSPTHEHTYSAEWTNDATNHWHACTGAGCTDKKDEAAHTPVAIGEAKQPTETEDGITAGQKCSVCGYVIEPQTTIPKIEAGHEHTYETAWSSDGTYHWHKTTCGHDAVDGVLTKESHTVVTIPAVAPTVSESGLTEGKKCSVCGKVLQEQTIVPPAECTSHVDENNDGRCDNCGKNIIGGDEGGEGDGDEWINNVTWETTTLIFQLTRNTNNNELSSGCERYLAGVSTTPQTIDLSVTQRNSDAEMYTNVTIDYKYVPDTSEYNWSSNIDRIFEETQNKSKNSPDMYCNFLTDLLSTSLKGSFANLYSSSRPGTNFFKASSGTTGLNDSGYMADLMSSLTLDLSKIYVIASDYFIDLIRAFFVVPVNIKMFNEVANTVVNGEKLLDDLNGDGVVDVSDFFQEVVDGGWTYERLAEYAAVAYRNDSGSTTANIGDQLGFALAHTSGLSAAGMVYTSSATIIYKAWDSTKNNGAGGYRYAYPNTNEGLVNLANKLDWLFSQTGVISVGNEPTYGASTLEAIRNRFSDNKILFGGVVLVGSLEDDVYQKMTESGEDDAGFGVVPVPLYTSYHEAKKYVVKDGAIVDSGSHNGDYDYDETTGTYVYNAEGTGYYDKDQYLTQIHVVGRGGAIAASTQKYEQCTAFLQYQSTHSSDILNDYYVYNLTLDAVGSGSASMEGNVEMMEYIRENVRTSFDKLFEDAIGFFYEATDPDAVNNRWHALINTDQYHMTNMAEKYASLITKKQQSLATLEAEYTKLPD